MNSKKSINLIMMHVACRIERVTRLFAAWTHELPLSRKPQIQAWLVVNIHFMIALVLTLVPSILKGPQISQKKTQMSQQFVYSSCRCIVAVVVFCSIPFEALSSSSPTPAPSSTSFGYHPS